MGIAGEFGSLLIGGLVAAMLYGVTTLQTYVYYMHYSEDASTVKFLVGAVWILDTLHVAFMCHILYYYLITNYGVLTSLEYDVWSFPASLLVNLLVVIVVQCFFTHKIYHLCPLRAKWLVTAPIILLLVAHFGFGIETTVLMLVNKDVSVIKQIRFYAATPFAATFVLIEVLITTSLCILLYDSGTRTTFSSTKRILTTLIIYVVNRCILVLLVALAEFVTTLELQSTWSTGLDFNLGKLYANSLLASLNTRQHLRSQDSTTGTNEGIRVVHFRNMSEGMKSSKEEERHGDMHEAAVIDITADPELEKTTASQRQEEV
ncbi:hypothetical protein PISMIDRAFT_678274 [Pisolithus microcarpus 441]|uniref:DUF6534 domain-containing protein n=1 Tax=Pisolithus microcarpus 441 TaxID=765257 RepID=A0A0C9ZXM1_9AGAM|nr:hypothetical protein PISMIDRAFT_678274 [Pisolithus microcarpus 441]